MNPADKFLTTYCSPSTINFMPRQKWSDD